MFQSTRPRGARPTQVRRQAPAGSGFQSTRPRGARQLDVSVPVFMTEFQSTRPRGARPRHPPSPGLVGTVSIHAPAWGATRAGARKTVAQTRFNPRARVGRDRCASATRRESGSFNPRARVGRDTVSRPFVPMATVSIHAPAWGATESRVHAIGDNGVSIHAPAWGATRTNLRGVTSHWFQSTRPRGARLAGGCRLLQLLPCFNPRARVGRDSRTLNNDHSWSSFQSTRPRGARPLRKRDAERERQFQSTRPRGARLWSTHAGSDATSFQSTRPRGARPLIIGSSPCLNSCFNPRARVGRDRVVNVDYRVGYLFQSTRPRGARHPFLRCEHDRFPVSIHAPAWGATQHDRCN